MFRLDHNPSGKEGFGGSKSSSGAKQLILVNWTSGVNSDAGVGWENEGDEVIWFVILI